MAQAELNHIDTLDQDWEQMSQARSQHLPAHGKTRAVGGVGRSFSGLLQLGQITQWCVKMLSLRLQHLLIHLRVGTVAGLTRQLHQLVHVLAGVGGGLGPTLH